MDKPEEVSDNQGAPSSLALVIKTATCQWKQPKRGGIGTCVSCQTPAQVGHRQYSGWEVHMAVSIVVKNSHWTDVHPKNLKPGGQKVENGKTKVNRKGKTQQNYYNL